MVNGISSFSTGSTLSAGTGIGAPPEDFKEKLTALGIPAETIAKGREAVMEYAQKNGISLPEPPTKPGESSNSSIFGQNSSKGEPKEPPAEIKQQLIALGIPETTIAQGREAVMQYSQENGITLPQPPAPPEAGSKLDFTA